MNEYKESDAVKRRMGATEQRYFERAKRDLGALGFDADRPDDVYRSFF